MRTGLARTLTGAATVAFLASGVLTAPPALAAQGDITTIAGGPGGPLPAAEMDQDVVGFALTPSRIWVVDERGYAGRLALRTIDRATGLESEPLLELPMPTRLQNYSPPTLAPEPNGNVLIAFNGPAGGIVADVTPTGQARVVAGGGSLTKSYVEGQPATAVQLGTLNGIAVSDKGVIYLSENGYAEDRTVYATDSMIVKIGTGGRLTSYAGQKSYSLGEVGYSGDGGPAQLAEFHTVMGLALDPAGNLYVADNGNARIRLIAPGTAGTAGIVTTVVSDTYAQSVSYDHGGLYFGDWYHALLQRLDTSGVTTVGGMGTRGWSGDDGPATAGKLAVAAVSASGGEVAFLQDWSYSPGFHSQVRLVDSSGTLRRVTGPGPDAAVAAGDGGPALRAQLGEYTQRTAVDAAGNVYVTYGSRLRRMSSDGTISTVVGTGVKTSVDTGLGGPATAASLRRLNDVVVAPNGDLYLSGEGRIYRVDGAGTITSVVGDGVGGLSPDGTPAADAHIIGPDGLALDATGNLLYADGCRIRRLDSAGLVTTIAGQAMPATQYGTCGHTDDGASATSGQLGFLHDVDVDALGRVLLVEYDGYGDGRMRVRRIGLDGLLTTVAGGGTSAADGVPATAATLGDSFLALAQDATGRLLISELTSGLVRRVELDGTISTIVGGGSGQDGGPAKGARLLRPSDVAAGPDGTLYVACTDTRTPYGGGAIRKVSQP